MTLTRLVLVGIAVLGTGCAAEATSCPRVVGQFQPLYRAVSGSCGVVMDPLLVDIDDVPQSVQTNIQMFPNGRLTTDIVRRGCSVQMSQLFESPMPGNYQSYILGKELNVESENEMSGMVSMTRWDAIGNVACFGDYDARLTKASATVGAAVIGAAASGR